jgi:opacity protein-like surface antigen
LGNFFRSEDNISAHYRWTPLFSTTTSYTFSAIEYPNSSASSLSPNSSASSLNRLENRFGEELRYLLFPATTATAEYNFNIADYQNTAGNQNTASNQNNARNPITQSLAAGLDQTFGPHLNGRFRGGVQLRSGQTSPYAEVALHYVLEPTRTTSESSTFVIWTNRYSIEESDVAAGSGRETFRTNLLLNYGISARVSANLSVSYLHATGQSIGSGLNGGGENLFDVSPGVRYAITPSLAVNIGYRHTELNQGSSRAVSLQSLGYSRNRYFAGLTFTF